MANEEQVLKIGKYTHAGKVRDLNEDSIATPEKFQIEREQQIKHGVLVALADGMGGHAAGEVASQIAVETLFKTFYADAASNPPTALRAGFTAAHAQVIEMAASDPNKSKMGSTLVAAVVKDGHALHIANVGDSRAYLVRGDTIRQITRDHSWVEEQVQAHVLTEEQASEHAFKNVITRAIGKDPEVKVDLFRLGLRSQDVIVLCSDGLSNKVEPNEIREVVTRTENPQHAAEELIRLANDHGGEDNISVIVVRIPQVRGLWLF